MVAAAALLVATAASGQVMEFGASVGESRFPAKVAAAVPGAIGNTGLSLDNGFRLTLHATLNTGRFYGHEFAYAYNRSQFNSSTQVGGIAVHQGVYDFLFYAAAEGKKIRPFAAGGGNFTTFTYPGVALLQGTGNGIAKVGFNFGGGVKVRLSSKFLVRFDYREFFCGTPQYYGSSQINLNSLFRQQTISAGFSFVL
jgi:hypothetical protein